MGLRDQARRCVPDAHHLWAWWSAEGYPTNPKKKTSEVFLYTGTRGAFTRAGFAVAARPSKAALIMRREL